MFSPFLLQSLLERSEVLSIYSPTSLLPNNTSVDATENITFSWSYNGSGSEALQTHYQVKIYKNIDNTLVFDSTKISSSNEYYTLSSTPLTNDNIYKFQVTVWSNSETSKSSWILFSCFENPTLTIGSTPTSTQTYTFTATYYSAQSIPIKTYRAYLFLASDLENPIADSEYIYPETLITNGSISYEFDGMETDETYAIQFICTNQNNYTLDTGQHTFTITYSYPPSIPDLVVTEDKTNGALILSWIDVQQKIGNVIGDFSYIESGSGGKFNNSIYLNPDSQLYYTESFLDGFTLSFWIKIPTAYVGTLIRLGDSNLGMRVFIEESNRFGFEYGEFITVGRVIEVSDNVFDYWILIGIKNGKIIIKGDSFEETLSVI